MPFEVLVERLNPPSLAHHPLVQVMLAWQNLPGQDSDPAAELALGDLQVTPLAVDTQTARMDLAFSLATLDRGGSAGRIGGWSNSAPMSSTPTSIHTLITGSSGC